MDKSNGNKKQSPAGTSRRAYSIFGGIINLAQTNAAKSNAVVSSSSSATSTSGIVSIAGGGSGTSQDPPGSSNVYTVTVTSSLSPPNCVPPSSAKTYENVAAMKKKKGDHSSSTSSSLTSSHSHQQQGIKTTTVATPTSGSRSSSSSSKATSRIGPAPRTLSILTALNELGIVDDIDPNPLAPSISPSNNPRSGGGCGNNNSSTSSANPLHSSSSHRPSKESIGIYLPTKTQGNIERGAALKSQKNVAASTSSASLHPSPSSTAPSHLFYHSSGGSRGLYNNQKCATNTSGTQRVKGSNELNRNTVVPPPPLPQSCFFPDTATSTNTLPGKLHTGYKSLGSHKESLGRKGAVKQQRDRSKSRTPDWIWKIFQLTKHGKLEELQQSLQGLDSTLIRHLADAKGNTIVHYAARGGHVSTLQWLVSVLGAQCADEALNDHNQAGRTVILTALKKGQVQCLQWLIQNTKCGGKSLVPSEGERSLLHHAVANGNINVVRWVCSELINKGIHVDIRDSSGMTPLHQAAKSGRVSICHELILVGADPLAETELGWRPSDLAIRHRHMECASYFMVAEAAGSLGNQLHSISLAFNHLRQEHEELRSYFREVLRVGKWLAKERNDLIKHFPSKISQESSTASSLLLGGTNNGARFSDMEHKLVVAEQGWKRICKSVDDVTETQLNEEDELLLQTVPSHDLLLRRLAAVQLRHERNQTLGNSLSGSSDEEDLYEENSSLSDASSSDTNVDCITSVTVGSPALLNSSATITHSTNVSPLIEQSTMKTRSKAAPWLLPPNDAFLSQLSPFVGAHPGRSLPTLDLLHGASSSPPLLSPIVTPSKSMATAVPTTDAAGKNEKSLVQMDAAADENKLVDDDHHHHPRKRDSLDISVLEVIEPTSHVSPSTSKNVQQAPDLICGTHLRAHADNQRKVEESLASLHSHRRRKEQYPTASASSSIDESAIDPLIDSLYEPVLSVSVMEHHSPRKKSVTLGEGSKLETFFNANATTDKEKGESLCKDKSHFQSVGSEQLAGPCSSPSGPFLRSDNENECAPNSSTSVNMAYCEGGGVIGRDLANSSPGKINFNSNPVDTALNGRSVTPTESWSDSRSMTSKAQRRSSSPKSYVTKLTVIPGEGNSEKCFLSMRCTSLIPEDQQQQRETHQLQHLPGENQEEISLGGLSCQIPSDSVSSSNTPVMPRFNSSGTVVFPVREPGWNCSELLSQTTPDFSLVGRLSPTPSETSRTESALASAAPPSCVSHVSLNSELSKTESARGQCSEETTTVPNPLAHSFINDDSSGNNNIHRFRYFNRAQPAAPSCSSSSTVLLGIEHDLQIRPEHDIDSTIAENGTAEERLSDSSSRNVYKSGKKKNGDCSSVRKKDDEDDNNDGSSRKQSGVFGIQVAPCFIRSHLSTSGNSGSSYKPCAQQRLPKPSHVKGHRGHFKPWYEIEGSDDEGSLLRVTNSRSGFSSKFSSSNSSGDGSSNNNIILESSSSHQEESSSQNESEENNGSGAERAEENEEINQQHSKSHSENSNNSSTHDEDDDEFSEFL